MNEFSTVKANLGTDFFKQQIKEKKKMSSHLFFFACLSRLPSSSFLLMLTHMLYPSDGLQAIKHAVTQNIFFSHTRTPATTPYLQKCIPFLFFYKYFAKKKRDFYQRKTKENSRILFS